MSATGNPESSSRVALPNPKAKESNGLPSAVLTVFHFSK